MIYFSQSLGTSRAIVAALLALGLGATASLASAQTVSIRSLCTSHGPNVREPMPDREGQSVMVADSTCVIQGGPMDGAAETQSNLWHYDKAVGTLVSSHGVARKPGSMSMYVNVSGTLNLQMSEGKVTGWTASGKGRFPLGTGGAASLAGKSYTWTASPTGPRSYIVSLIVDQ